MDVEEGPKQIDQQPELPKVETPAKPPTDDSGGLASRDREIEIKQAEAKKRDEAKKAEIRASLGLEQVTEQGEIKQHLQAYLGLKEGAVERMLQWLALHTHPCSYNGWLCILHHCKLFKSKLS